jgi:thioredoxin-related protein
MKTLRLLVIISILAVSASVAEAAELVMFESQGCPYCAEWDRKIGPIYAKTDEGKKAPLRRVDIHAPRPADLAEINPVIYTPTFVLVEDGQEVGRLEGYAGEDFFWSLLGDQLGKLKDY